MRNTGKKTNAQLIKLMQKKHDEVSYALGRDKTRSEALGAVLSELNSQITNYTNEKEKSLREACVASDRVLDNSITLEESNKELNTIKGLVERLNGEFKKIELEKKNLESTHKKQIKEVNSLMNKIRKQAEKDTSKIKKTLDNKIDELSRANDRVRTKDIEINSKINQIKKLNENIIVANDVLVDKRVEMADLKDELKKQKVTKRDIKLTEQRLLEVKNSLKEKRRLNKKIK